MDYLIKQILEELELDLQSLENELYKLENDETFKQAEKMLEKFKEKGKKSLLEDPLFGFYLASCALVNDEYSYKEIEADLKAIEEAINAWNKEDIPIMNAIETEYRNSSLQCNERYIVTTYPDLLNLGLTEEMHEKYNVITSFNIIGPIIIFRNRIKQYIIDTKGKITTKKAEEIFTTTNIASVLKTIENYMQKERMHRQERHQYLKKGIEAVKKFMQEVKESQEINEMPNYVKKYLSANTKELIYYLFNKTLQKENIVLEAQIEICEQILSDPIIKLLYENNIDPNLIEKSKLDRLRKLPFEKVERGIKIISLLKLPKVELLNREDNIIDEIDFDSLDMLTFFYENGIVTEKTFQNHLTVLTREARKVITNYEILKSIMDFKSQYYDDTLLLSEPTSVQERLSVLAEYSLTKNDYIFLLCHYEYITIYDLILEQNIPRYLFIQICKTSNPILTIKRICLYMLLDIPYKTTENLLKKDVKEERFFICEDASLDKYLSLIESPKEEGTAIGNIKKTDIVRKLDEEYRIEDIYCFNNTNVSRPKFLKKLQRIKDEGKDIEDYVQRCLLADSFVNERNILEIKRGVKKLTSSQGL